MQSFGSVKKLKLKDGKPLKPKNSSSTPTGVRLLGNSAPTTAIALKKKAEVDAMKSDGIKGNYAAYMKANGGKYADDTPTVAVGEPNPSTPNVPTPRVQRAQARNQTGERIDRISQNVSRRGVSRPGYAPGKDGKTPTSIDTGPAIPMPKSPINSPVTTPVTANSPSAGKPGSIDQVNPGRAIPGNNNSQININGTTAGGMGRMSAYDGILPRARRSRQ